MKVPTAIFWDYENIPFRHNDWRGFVAALNSFIKSNKICFAKCFYRENNVSEDDRILLQLVQRMKLKRVEGTEHNAVDKVIIQSCQNLISRNSEIKQVLIISGDGDYLPLVTNLKSKQINVSVICIRSHGNRRLIKNVVLYPYEVLLNLPDEWWLYPSKKYKKEKNKKKKHHPKKKSVIKPISDEDYDPYAHEDLPIGWYVYDDGAGEFQRYDLNPNTPAFVDDEEDI
jgi:NYN domain-containing protein